MSLFLLLLFVCSCQATGFFGTVMTYDPKTSNNGDVTVVIRYKLNFHLCNQTTTWQCLSGRCGTSSVVLNRVDSESSGEWCQTEGIMTFQAPSDEFQLGLSRAMWTNNIVNGIVFVRAKALVELRNRSDTGHVNRSPRTTILPALRVPSNCQRQINLLAFDSDGDEVKCRYGNAELFECSPCTPPSVLDLSPSCDLTFSSTSSSNEGLYAVQLVMEDFARQTINLISVSGTQTLPSSFPVSAIPVQFVLKVDPAVPSCTEGLYLPAFLPPTPANRARLHTPVNQTLDISIKAAATFSTVSELLFSGPHNVNQTRSGPGQFTLSWTPSQSEDGESQPICFIVQALSNSTKYHSELRCVIVSVGNDPSFLTSTAEVISKTQRRTLREVSPGVEPRTVISTTSPGPPPGTEPSTIITAVTPTTSPGPPPMPEPSTVISTTSPGPPPGTEPSTIITAVTPTTSPGPPPMPEPSTIITTATPTTSPRPPPGTEPSTIITAITPTTSPGPPPMPEPSTIITTATPTTSPRPPPGTEPSTIITAVTPTTSPGPPPMPEPSTIITTATPTTSPRPPPGTEPSTIITAITPTTSPGPPPGTEPSTIITAVTPTTSPGPPPMPEPSTVISTTSPGPPPGTEPSTIITAVTPTTSPGPPPMPEPSTIITTATPTTSPRPPPGTEPSTIITAITPTTSPGPPPMPEPSTIITTATPTTSPGPPPGTEPSTIITAITPTTLPGPTSSSQQIVIRLTARISSVVALTEEYIRSTVVQQIQNKLVTFGLPPSANLTLLGKV